MRNIHGIILIKNLISNVGFRNIIPLEYINK